jgi:hypothetical protein
MNIENPGVSHAGFARHDWQGRPLWVTYFARAS